MVQQQQKLTIEKGKPLGEDEVKISFYLFQPEDSSFAELFELGVEQHALLSDVKKNLSKTLKQEKSIIIDPKFMRIRECFADIPSTVYKDHLTLNENAFILYNGKRLAIQRLNQPGLNNALQLLANLTTECRDGL
jgi:hypothetical protein